MDRRGHRRQMTQAEHAAYLYRSSSDKFYVEHGTVYPCCQGILDFHREGRFLRKNRGPFFSLSVATEELMVQNDETRRPSMAEIDAISKLRNVVRDRAYRAHPDLVIKAFNDLDTVFFGGRLRGNVLVFWANSVECEELGPHNGGAFYGCTMSRNPEENGQACIFLNARDMFLEYAEDESPLRAMFCTLLHEMVHAYEFVRCPYHVLRRNPHDEYFSTSIDAVHKRALRILGINAISGWEPYQQEFLRLESTVDDTYTTNPHSTYGSSRHYDRSRHDDGKGKGIRDGRSRTGHGGRGWF